MARNQPWWQCLHHRTRQTLQSRAPLSGPAFQSFRLPVTGQAHGSWPRQVAQAARGLTLTNMDAQLASSRPCPLHTPPFCLEDPRCRQGGREEGTACAGQ